MHARTQRLVRLGLALGIGSLGGVAGWVAGLPLPFMLGAMLATMAAALAGLPMAMPKALRNTVAPVFGVMFGSTVQLEALPEIGTVLGLSALVAAHLAVTISLGWLFFRRVGLDPITSYFAAVPGNFSDMMLFADQQGANLRAVVVVHSIRLVVALSLLSFGLRFLLGPDLAMVSPHLEGALTARDLAILMACGVLGYALARLVRLPAAQLFGPLVASALVHGLGWTDSVPPGWLVTTAQVVLGVFAGVRFTGVALRESGLLVVASLAWSVLLLLLVIATASIGSHLLGLPLTMSLLALAPGGAVELNMLAMAAGLSVALVSVAHLLRIVLSLLVGPALVRVIARRR